MKKSRLIAVIYILILLFSILLPNFYCKKTSNKSQFEKSCINLFKSDFIMDFKIKFFKNRFIIYKQPNISIPNDGFPIVFLFHGAVQHGFSWFLGLNAWNRAQVSFTKSALENGFFVVSFESLKPIKPGPRAWDCFEKNDTLNSDILYVKEVINWLNNSCLPVNVNNIFCAGLSSGAFFCSRLAQSYNYSFKGVILNSGCNADSIIISNNGPDFNCSTGFNISYFHPPTLIVHGRKDRLISYKCAESYYLDLKYNKVDVTKFVDEEAGHIWLNDYNCLIVDWLKKHQ